MRDRKRTGQPRPGTRLTRMTPCCITLFKMENVQRGHSRLKVNGLSISWISGDRVKLHAHAILCLVLSISCTYSSVAPDRRGPLKRQSHFFPVIRVSILHIYRITLLSDGRWIGDYPYCSSSKNFESFRYPTQVYSMTLEKERSQRKRIYFGPS
jgi:hypothetical protein